MTRLTVLLCIMLPAAVSADSDGKTFTLVVDAGHGGHDTGAQGAISKEKDLNLAVALAFGKYVKKNCPDVKVIYTRDSDVFVPLKERAAIANRNHANLFISFHTNALPAGSIARGFETYTLGMHRAKDNLDVAMRENSVISMEKGYRKTYEGFDPKSSESYIMFEFIQGANMERSVELARMIQESVVKHAGRPDKGVHQAGFLVLRETSMPSCLIELGFISTPDEEEDLNKPSVQKDIAKAVYKAFVKYKDTYGAQNEASYIMEDDPVKAPPVPVSTPVPANDMPADRSNSRKQASQQGKTQQSTAPSKPSANTQGSNKQKNAQSQQSASGTQNKNTTAKANDKNNSESDKPVFKVQIMAVSQPIPKGDERLKGITNYEYYKDGNIYKYTVGSSTDYNVIYKLRKDELLEKFPEAFIIAFKNGKRTDVVAAIKEYLVSKGVMKADSK